MVKLFRDKGREILFFTELHEPLIEEAEEPVRSIQCIFIIYLTKGSDSMGSITVFM